jgi:hypothetical protein
MDLKQYFKKINETQAIIAEAYPLIVSLETSDGGKPGAMIEVSRQEAAKAIVEGRGILATLEQQAVYAAQEAARKVAAEKTELSRRLQIAIISDADLRSVVSQQEKPEKDEKPKGSR